MTYWQQEEEIASRVGILGRVYSLGAPDLQDEIEESFMIGGVEPRAVRGCWQFEVRILQGSMADDVNEDLRVENENSLP